MIRMFLIRHGQSTYNSAKESLQELEAVPGPDVVKTPCDVDPSLHDAALSEKGCQQARAVVAPSVDVILVSPLTRALQTASLLYPSRHNEFVVVPGATEFSAMCDLGRPASTLQKEFPTVSALSGLEEMWWAGDSSSHLSVDAFRENAVSERMETFTNRLRKVMSDHITPLPDSVQAVALIAHHDTIAHFVSLHFGGLPEEYHMQNCEVMEIAFDRKTLLKGGSQT